VQVGFDSRLASRREPIGSRDVGTDASQPKERKRNISSRVFYCLNSLILLLIMWLAAALVVGDADKRRRIDDRRGAVLQCVAAALLDNGCREVLDDLGA
jgi:hypothetical protein